MPRQERENGEDAADVGLQEIFREDAQQVARDPTLNGCSRCRVKTARRRPPAQPTAGIDRQSG